MGGGTRLHDGFENVFDADALLGAGENGVAGVEADHLLDLLADALGLGGRQIDLVDDRDDLEVVVQRQIGIGERLRFHALRRVHHQQRAFARLQAARHLVSEVDVAGRVDQVELILVPVLRLVSRAGRHGL